MNPVIADVLDALRRSRQFLLDPSPQNIDRCRTIIGQCAERIAPLAANPELASNAGEDFAASIQRVRDELGSIAALLASAATFQRDLLKAMYTAAGAPAIPVDTAPEKVRRLHVLG